MYFLFISDTDYIMTFASIYFLFDLRFLFLLLLIHIYLGMTSIFQRK